MYFSSIELSTCGIISPLKSIDYLIKQLKPDIDNNRLLRSWFYQKYKCNKTFIDHNIQSTQNFISNKTKSMYNVIDVNIHN